MSTRRRQEMADSTAAARRLAGLALRPGVGSGGVPGARDDGGWSAGSPDDDPDDDPGGGPDDFDWFFPAPVQPPGAPVVGGVPVAAEASHGRWRSLVERAPGSVLGAAGVPLNAAVAVVLVVAAVVAGVVLRTHGASSEVVDVGPARARAGAQATPTMVEADPAGTPRPGPAAVGLPAGAAVGGGVPSSTPVGVVVVDVVGKVRRPGLVRLPAGSRVADAVAAAGGPTDAASLPRINLARLLADGEQVVVPDADDPLPAAAAAGAPAGSGGPSGAPAHNGPLDLNTATAADLDGLPGVGPVIAGRIVAWRAEHQRFTRVDELAEVAGIGDRLLERLRPLVTV